MYESRMISEAIVADLEKEQMTLKVTAATLNQKAMLLLAAGELVAEYRQLTSRLLGHCESLKKNLDSLRRESVNTLPTNEVALRNGRTVSGQASAASGPDSR
jgi:hypothetical protein